MPTGWSAGSAFSRLIIRLVWTILCLAQSGLANAQTTNPGFERPARVHGPLQLEANALLLEVRLDGHVLSDGLTAYRDGNQILLPLGELARLLTLAISVDLEAGVASGFVVREDSGFALNAVQSTATVGGKTRRFEPRRAVLMDDDIYVSHQLLSRWLPVDLVLDLPTLQLRVKPRVRLPLQERLGREALGTRTSGARAQAPAVNYPKVLAPIKIADTPFIDQTLGSDARVSAVQRQARAAYTAYVAGDVAGMEGAAYVMKSTDRAQPEVHVTLSRHDPEGELLGPMRARALSVGHVALPGVPYVMTGSSSGQGLTVSNRPAWQPSSFDRHTLRGDLPPGWDVTLYYNDALLAYQGTGKDGQYVFDDLPLSFGANEFRLVFNGPLGQVRVEKRSFSLDQGALQAGEFYYGLAQQQDERGGLRQVAQFDLGLSRALAANVGLIRRPRLNSSQSDDYMQWGLRHYGDSLIGSAQLTGSSQGGAMAEANIKTRVYGYALELTHAQRLGDFVSEALPGGSAGLHYRDKLRLNGAWLHPMISPVSFAVEASRDVMLSGAAVGSASARLSSQVRGTSLANSLRWVRGQGSSMADGSLQISRRVLDVGISAQMDYALRPRWATQAFVLTADRSLAAGVRVNASILKTTSDGLTQLSLGASKNLGSFALAISGAYSSRREVALGLQLFVGMGRDPRTGRWMTDAQPMATSGGVSARAFVDRNGNGVRDDDEVLLPGVGFVVNQGARHPTRTDKEGVAFIGRLPTAQYADISLDAGTLEDPQWRASVPGLRVLPRPGHVDQLEFPVVSSSEIEGTVYLLDKGIRRTIGDVRMEAVNVAGQVVATAKSASDGYYLLHHVAPGAVCVRISPAQVHKLRLAGELEKVVLAPADGDFLAGLDFELRLLGRANAEQSQ